VVLTTFNRFVTEAFRSPIQVDLQREHVSTTGNDMSTEPEQTSAENLEREDQIERVPEGSFGGTRERLREIEGDGPVAG
jgi:hypothetical protein